MSEREEDGLQAEVLAELRGLRAQARSAGGGPSGPAAWLNAPFVVTVLGGLVATGLTLLWQHAESERDHARALQSESVARQHALIADFPRRFSASLDFLLAFKERELWLRAHSLDDGERYPDGKTYAEIRDVHEALYEKYLLSGSSDALCAQIRATFGSEQVTRLATTLDEAMDEFVQTKDTARLYELYDAADARFQELIASMGDAVRPPGERGGT